MNRQLEVQTVFIHGVPARVLYFLHNKLYTVGLQAGIYSSIHSETLYSVCGGGETERQEVLSAKPRYATRDNSDGSLDSDE